jgi:DNA repair protein RadC
MSTNLIAATGALYVQEPNGQYRQASSEEVFEVARETMKRHFKRDVKLSDPASVRRYLTLTMATLPRETFRMLLLDAQHQVLKAVDVSVGTLDAAAVYPREVVKLAVTHDAAAVVFAHQHPSGIPEPSSADRLLTDRLKAALAMVDVRVLDHFVIGGTSAVSFAERGWL